MHRCQIVEYKVCCCSWKKSLKKQHKSRLINMYMVFEVQEEYVKRVLRVGREETSPEDNV